MISQVRNLTENKYEQFWCTVLPNITNDILCSVKNVPTYTLFILTRA